MCITICDSQFNYDCGCITIIQVTLCVHHNDTGHTMCASQLLIRRRLLHLCRPGCSHMHFWKSQMYNLHTGVFYPTTEISLTVPNIQMQLFSWLWNSLHLVHWCILHCIPCNSWSDIDYCTGVQCRVLPEVFFVVIHSIALSVQMYNVPLQACTMPGGTRRVFVIHCVVLWVQD